MNLNQLNNQEIQSLLLYYDSELRKLSYQMQNIISTIHSLHEKLENKVIQSTLNSNGTLLGKEEKEYSRKMEFNELVNVDKNFLSKGKRRIVNEDDDLPPKNWTNLK